MIQLLQPLVGSDELRRISQVFESNWLGKGDVVKQFETEFARHINAESERIVSTTCATEALFFAPELFDIKPGDEVIAPTISFIAVGNAIVSKKAQLVLCDVDRHTLNVTAEHLESKLTKRTRAVILTHYGGLPCDMDPILELCGSRGIAVVEDSACAIKSYYKGKACGTIGDMGIWSFDYGKVITAGDGGMVYFKSKGHVGIAKEQWYLGLSEHDKSGIDRASAGKANWWEIEIERPGRRAIMNNIAAAIGLAQLDKVDQFIARRKAIDERYREELSASSWITLPPIPPKQSESCHYFFWIQVEQRDELALFLREHGIYSTFRYWPLHKVRYFNHKVRGFTNADYASRHTLNIPLHHGLSDDDVTQVIELIKQFGTRTKRV
jgi:dTDP-4-amino-4,6-dideoxygalactose transaminase